MKRLNSRVSAVEPEKIGSEREARQAVAKLRKVIPFHDRKYYEEKAPVIADAECDRLVESLRELENKFPNRRSPDRRRRKLLANRAPALLRPDTPSLCLIG